MFERFSAITDWVGHYDKPLTRESVYHVSRYGQIRICLNEIWDRYLYEAVMDGPASQLAYAVNDCKRSFSYNNHPGGSFCINEFGIVIVPISTGGCRYVLPKAIGRWTGTLRFRDGYKVFSLDGDENLSPGDPWPHPYIGMKYRLAGDTIFYRLEDNNAQTRHKAPPGNDAIKQHLRAIRGYGEISFVVNNHGIVLVRRNDDDDNSAVYVGRVDMASWYPDPLRADELSDLQISEIIIRLKKIYPRPRGKDFDAFQNINNIYWDNGHRLTNIGMKQTLLALARRYLKEEF